MRGIHRTYFIQLVDVRHRENEREEKKKKGRMREREREGKKKSCRCGGDLNGKPWAQHDASPLRHTTTSPQPSLVCCGNGREFGFGWTERRSRKDEVTYWIIKLRWRERWDGEGICVWRIKLRWLEAETQWEERRWLDKMAMKRSKAMECKI